MILERIKLSLRLLYHAAKDSAAESSFWFRRKTRKWRRDNTSADIKGTLCILCVKRPAYVRLALKNINSLHFIYPGYRVRIITDDICAAVLDKLITNVDYSNLVEVINMFGSGNEPWQFQKVECLMEASRNGWILVDADTIWHGEPVTNPELVTLLVKAYDFGDNKDERAFLAKNSMPQALSWPHFVTGFVSLPTSLYSDTLAKLAMDWTRKVFADDRLKRISEEIGVNLAIQALIPRDKITTLKQSDGPNDKHIMQSLYYGCVNDVQE